MPAEIAIRLRKIKDGKGFEASLPLLKLVATGKTEAAAIGSLRQMAFDALTRMIAEVKEYEIVMDGNYVDELSLSPEEYFGEDGEEGGSLSTTSRKHNHKKPPAPAVIESFDLAKPIPRFKGKYGVTPNGTVYSMKKGTRRVTTTGHLSVTRNGETVCCKVSDLVAEVYGMK